MWLTTMYYLYEFSLLLVLHFNGKSWNRQFGKAHEDAKGTSVRCLERLMTGTHLIDLFAKDGQRLVVIH